jgi:asparagine synthase (glutamine-hydrolysing)
MFGATRRTCITFNGEIYGFREMRRLLGGYLFRTSSETELLLALYEKYGRELLGQLPGMFSFGIWDDERSIFFAARDRFGEKPFYFA